MKLEFVHTELELEIPKNSDIGMFLDKAYDFLKDMESYPKYMSNVTRVDITSSHDGGFLVDWETCVDSAEFNWKQVNTYDDVNRTINFEMVEGDFEILKGKWQVSEKDKAYYLVLDLEYAIGLPVIEDVLGPILTKKMHENSLAMLTSIKKEMGEAHVH